MALLKCPFTVISIIIIIIIVTLGCCFEGAIRATQYPVHFLHWDQAAPRKAHKGKVASTWHPASLTSHRRRAQAKKAKVSAVIP